MLGGLAEFSKEELTILANIASTVEEFDISNLMARIDAMQDNLAKIPIGEELDRAIEQLDHYKSIHKSLDSDHGLLASWSGFSRSACTTQRDEALEQTGDSTSRGSSIIALMSG